MTEALALGGALSSAGRSPRTGYDSLMRVRPRKGFAVGAGVGAPGALDDWKLLALAKTDVRAFGELFERHRDYVFRLAWGFAGHSPAEDITQEVFTRVLAHRRRWVRRAKFTTLLYQITLNIAREFRRRHGREVSVDLGEPSEMTGLGADLHVNPANPELHDLGKALHTLSDRQREVVVLRHLEGLNTRETAKVLGCAEGSVKVHLHRGMAGLRKFLENDGGEPQPSTKTPVSASTH